MGTLLMVGGATTRKIIRGEKLFFSAGGIQTWIVLQGHISRKKYFFRSQQGYLMHHIISLLYISHYTHLPPPSTYYTHKVNQPIFNYQ